MVRARRTAVAAGLGCVLASLALVPLPGLTPAAEAAIIETDSAIDLATAIAGPGALVTNAGFARFPETDLHPHGVMDSSLAGFPTDGSTAALLTTGEATTIQGETPDDAGTQLDPTYDVDTAEADVSILRVDLDVPATANCLSFDFRYFSDEYPDFVDKAYNDAFVAELDSTTWTGSVTWLPTDPPSREIELDAPGNFAFDGSGNEISVNAIGLEGFSAANAEGTSYGGATTRLSAATPLTPGAHSLYLSIMDMGDRILDSAVMVDNLRVGFVPEPDAQCVPGAFVKNFQLDLTPEEQFQIAGEQHEVTVQLDDLNADPSALGDVPVQFSVSGANPTSDTAVTDADGVATFSYSGTAPGTDTISACYDADESGACDADEPFASGGVTWEVLERPRVAFTDDRDETWTVEVDRDLDDHDDDPETGYLENFDVVAGSRDRAGIRRARHTGEASPSGFGSATYVSTIQDRHGEVYLSHEGEGGLSFSNTSNRQRITCGNDALESHPVYSNGLVAWASDIDGDWDIYVAYQLDGGPNIPVGDRVGGACGDWEAFLITEDPEPAPDEDEPPRVDDLWPAWTPDGEALVYSSTRDDPLGDIYRIPVDDGPAGEPVRQTDHPGADTQPSVGDYQDEDWIAFTTTRFRPDGSIGILRATTNDEGDPPHVTPAWPGGRQGSEPAWGGEPDDPNIAFTSTENDAYGDVWVADLADAQGENAPQFRSGGVDPVADLPGVAESHPTWHDDFFDTPDDDGSVDLFRPAPPWALNGPLPAAAPPDDEGALLFTVRAMDADVSDVLAADGSQRRRIVHEGFGEGGTYDEAGPDYSPDGKRIAFSRDVVTDGGGREIMLADADGTNPESLAELTDRGLGDEELPGDVDSDPVWSPDGTRIAFVRQRGVEDLGNGPPTIWVVSLTGGPLFEIPTSHDGELYVDTDPTWSPDGRFLAIARQSSAVPQLGPVGNARRGGPWRQLGTEHQIWVVPAVPESDDAARLVHIYADPFASDGPNQQPLKELVRGRSPAWSPDGGQIAYHDRGAVRLVDLDPEGPSEADFTDREWEIINTPQAVTGFHDDNDAFPVPFGQTGNPTESRARISVAEDPAWRDDGLEIAFAGQPAGQPDQRGIYAIAPDGSLESLRMLTDLHPLDQDEDQPRDQDARGPETEPTWQPAPTADVSVTVTIAGSPAAATLPFTATYVVTNNGPSKAQGVTLATAVPAGGARQAVAPPAGCLPDGSGCAVSELEQGATLTYEVRLSYPAALDGTASGTVASLTADPLLANNTASAPFRVNPPPASFADVSVTITLDNPIGYVGGQRTATVTVKNLGPAPALGVTLGTTYPEFVTPDATPVCLEDGTLCPVGDLASAEEKAFTIELNADEAGTGELVAEVAATTPDPKVSNNRAVADFEVKQPKIRLLPAVARPGQVVLAYGEDMPPGTRVTLDWEPGITVDDGPFRVRADGTLTAALLLVRRDRLGERILTATSVTDKFSPVTGDMLVVLRLMSPPDFVGRG